MQGIAYNLYIELCGENFSAVKNEKGFFSIGVGHGIDERLNEGITQQQSRVIYDTDIKNAQLDAAGHLPWWRDLDDVRRDAITMTILAVGIGNVIALHRMAQAILDGNFSGAAFELSNSSFRAMVSNELHQRITDAIETGRW